MMSSWIPYCVHSNRGSPGGQENELKFKAVQGSEMMTDNCWDAYYSELLVHF